MSEMQLGMSGASKEGRIARSWRLTKAAWVVVRADRSLRILALAAALVGVLGVVAIFAIGGISSQRRASGEHFVVVALVFVYPLTFLGAFVNTAIAAAAAAALDGRHLSVGEALAVPWRRIGQIAVWALIAAIVGYVLEQLTSRLPFGGSIAARLVGLIWSLASFFVIPVLALEDRSATDSLRRSAHVIKERWGEGVSGSIMISAWTVLVTISLLIVFAVCLAVTFETPVARDLVIVLGALALLSIVAIQLVVRQTFAVALYRYATTGEAPGPFEEDDLRSPFSRKRGLFG
ncbi:MAG: DUF6159 family protein [Solirubrobacteraceae bacterium]